MADQDAAALQADVLRRVVELDETSPEVISDLEQSLQHLLAEDLRAVESLATRCLSWCPRFRLIRC